MTPFAYFVTGTDTGVGKTWITASLAAFWYRQGYDVGVMKPIETGVKGPMWPDDAKALMQASHSADAQEFVVPYTFEPPVSPWAATLMTGKRVDWNHLIETARAVIARHQVTLIEGAGGIAVPIDADHNMIHIAQELDIPVILVARTALGTINHTVLSVEYAKTHRVKILGIIMNAVNEVPEDVSTTLNPSLIESLTGIPVWSVVPFQPVNDDAPENYLTTLWEQTGQRIAWHPLQGGKMT
ncbi:dethiobiotin synthase [Sulfobacillus thermosulfidooxidans]|uniref:dethiobiotin synthase n=1 Tax=Sulfobacillus thermosulfidooxidans TaxID=28034 RepID=UPI0006B64850|nr:dethiobiotin synthase [Sulfobacillus thermosulfidooxidans]